MGGIVYSPDDLAAHRVYLERLRTDYAALDERRTALRTLIDAAEAYLRLLTDQPSLVEPPEQGPQAPPPPHVVPPREPPSLSLTASEWARILRGTTQLQALERIAGLNGGVVRVTEARDIFRLIGRMRGTSKNLSSHLHNLMNNSPKFEKKGPGVFYMLPAAPEPQSSLFSEEVTQVSEHVDHPSPGNTIPRSMGGDAA